MCYLDLMLNFGYAAAGVGLAFIAMKGWSRYKKQSGTDSDSKPGSTSDKEMLTLE